MDSRITALFQVFNHIHSTFGSNRVSLSLRKSVRGGSTLPIYIDLTITGFNILITGPDPSVIVQDPTSTPISSYIKNILLPNLMEISVRSEQSPTTGEYNIIVEGSSNQTWEVEVTGHSILNIEYGFALDKDAKICSTYRKPIGGGKL